MKIISVLFFISVFSLTVFAQAVPGKTEITGDEMEVLKTGEVIISKGNSKAVNGRNTIKADKMTYVKKDNTVSAEGNVRLSSKTDDDEPLEARGRYAKYDTGTERGKLWGNNTKIEYYMKSSSSPLVLKAQEVYVDRHLETLSAYTDVEVVTSSGTIFSDNAVFDKNDESIVMKKDKKRPVADVDYDGRKGVYEADAMTFYNAEKNKKIIMSGDVKGTVEMEDKIQ